MNWNNEIRILDCLLFKGSILELWMKKEFEPDYVMEEAREKLAGYKRMLPLSGCGELTVNEKVYMKKLETWLNSLKDKK